MKAGARFASNPHRLNIMCQGHIAIRKPAQNASFSSAIFSNIRYKRNTERIPNIIYGIRIV